MAIINGWEVQFYKFNSLIHIYEVKGLHDKLLKYKNKILKNYYTQKDKVFVAENKYNTPFTDPSFYHEFDSLLYGIVNNYYLVGEVFDPKTIGIYIQTPDSYRSMRHNHYNSGMITSTLYIDPIENIDEGGGIEFYIGSESQDQWIIYPKKDNIYFFPSWLIHSPLPQTREKERICLNWGYDTNIRPIHKVTGDRW
jgi:hypothetical protein